MSLQRIFSVSTNPSSPAGNTNSNRSQLDFTKQSRPKLDHVSETFSSSLSLLDNNPRKGGNVMLALSRDENDDETSTSSPSVTSSQISSSGRGGLLSNNSNTSVTHGAYYGIGSETLLSSPLVSQNGAKALDFGYAPSGSSTGLRSTASLVTHSSLSQLPGATVTSVSTNGSSTSAPTSISVAVSNDRSDRPSTNSAFGPGHLHQSRATPSSRLISAAQRGNTSTPPSSSSSSSIRLPASSLSRVGGFPTPSTSSALLSGSSSYYESNDSEFPALGRPGRRSSQGNVGIVNPTSLSSFSSTTIPATAPTTPAGAAPQQRRSTIYGLLTKSRDEEFTIHSEDFPALQATGSGFRQGNRSSMMSDGKSAFAFSAPLRSLSDSTPLSGSVPVEAGREVGSVRAPAAGIIGQKIKPAGVQSLQSSLSDSLSSPPTGGIQTASDGRVSNIPNGMVTDQFGLVGLLTFIRAAETEPNLVALALGTDLPSLGLCLTSQENLYSSFTSPFSDYASKAQDIDYPVPKEYEINRAVGDSLAPIKLHKYQEDLLFYLYYLTCGDVLQLAASAELYQRDWRFHKEEHVWLQRVPGMEPTVKNQTYERGHYQVFEVVAWRKMTREMHIQYDQLEEPPRLPQAAQGLGST